MLKAPKRMYKHTHSFSFIFWPSSVFKVLLHLNDELQLVQEPLVNLSEVPDVVHSKACMERLHTKHAHYKKKKRQWREGEDQNDITVEFDNKENLYNTKTGYGPGAIQA